MSEQIYRLHYRGQLKENVSMETVQQAAELCVENIRRAQKQGKVLTAALYYWKRMLFFYYEAVGEPLSVVEPCALTSDSLPESGEDMQITCLHPEELLVPLTPFLQIWPGQTDDRLWVHMYHVFYHSIPEGVEDWTRAKRPEFRRGRIAFLREDKLYSYLYYHKSLVDEGLLTGDKYQSIAIHENILFSYFEEPKIETNVKKDLSKESEVVRQWFLVNPNSHFIHMSQGNGGNFMFLPALFAVGVEDFTKKDT